MEFPAKQSEVHLRGLQTRSMELICADALSPHARMTDSDVKHRAARPLEVTSTVYARNRFDATAANNPPPITANSATSATRPNAPIGPGPLMIHMVPPTSASVSINAA